MMQNINMTCKHLVKKQPQQLNETCFFHFFSCLICVKWTLHYYYDLSGKINSEKFYPLPVIGMSGVHLYFIF